MSEPLIAIGGVGGSGTRIIASTLRNLGFDCGDFVNDAMDNLSFTFLFRDVDLLQKPEERFVQLFDVFLKSLHGNQSVNSRDLKILQSRRDRLVDGKISRQIFAEKMLNGVVEMIKRPENQQAKFWKEPNTHIFLPQLLSHRPDLKYIHVIRNGLDMALSKNIRQFKFWGPALFDLPANPDSNSLLRYWAKSNLRSIRSLEENSADHLIVRFEEFCRDPDAGIREIALFTECDISQLKIDRLSQYVNRPKSIGRYRHQDIGPIDSNNIKCLEKLGYL